MSISRKTPKKTSTSVDFEKSLKQLNLIIEKMESGSLSLDASLKQFEEGINLIRSCQCTLTEAEQKVKILIGKSVNDFDSHEKQN